MMKPTLEQAIVITGYTGVMACPFPDFIADVQRRLGRTIWVHELADESVRLEIRELYKQDFIDMFSGLDEPINVVLHSKDE